MVAHADREALERTLATGEMHYRSRARAWHKGATSGNVQRVVSLAADCDGDALLARVVPSGPACHTGSVSCFVGPESMGDALSALDATIAGRAADAEVDNAHAPHPPKTKTSSSQEQSYTVQLLDDRNLRLKKLGEEAAELIAACADGDLAARHGGSRGPALSRARRAARRRRLARRCAARARQARDSGNAAPGKSARTIRNRRSGGDGGIAATRALSFAPMTNRTLRSRRSRVSSRTGPAAMSQLAPYTTFKIGGPADLFFEATSADALANAVPRRASSMYPTSSSGSAPTCSSATGAFAASSSETPRTTSVRSDDGTLWVESGAVMRDLIQEAVASRMVGARALRRHSEHRRRRHLAEPALPLAGAGARAHDVHRRGVRVVRDPVGGE